jgi:hypothetical protein
MITSWAQYISAIDRLANSALFQLGHEDIDLGEIEDVGDLGECPAVMREQADRAMFQLHEVITAYEQRQSVLQAELHRRPKSARSEPEVSLFDISA